MSKIENEMMQSGVLEEEKYEKDKSRGKRRKQGFKSKKRKMQIARIRKKSKNHDCGIVESKSGKYCTHCKSEEKGQKKGAAEKKVRAIPEDVEIKSGSSYKKLYDMN